MAQVFEKNSWVWIPDEDEIHLPAKVLDSFQKGTEGTVETEHGERRTLSAKESASASVMDEESLGERDDMVNFNDLSEGPLLHNLRKRFLDNKIYTYVGSILVAINPFKQLPLYTLDVLNEYVKSGNAKNCPPHCFAIAAGAYNQLLEERRNQAICISGESGAGKTESMKLMLQFLAEASGRSAAGSADADDNMEQKIIETNPVTEGFGNAKTLRNNNSSRFGKWTAVNMSASGRILSASITQYLLEKSRVTFQSEGERNYHVFYQAFAACAKDASWATKLRLGSDMDEYHYVNQSSAQQVDGIDDAADFDDLVRAMNSLHIPEEEINSIMSIVAGVIHMGNITFSQPAGGDEAVLEDPGGPAFTACAELLKVNPDDFIEALISKNIGTRSVVRMAYTVEAAEDARDAMARATYGRLFEWLITKINVGLGANITAAPAKSSSRKRSVAGQALLVGVLDIFGFEFFETNSFEQLCINLTNEKLQFHFNEHIFTLEAKVYEEEGVDVGLVTFSTNEPTLELLEAKRTGIFAMCDEEVQVGQRGSDSGFLSKVLAKHKDHPNLEKPKPKQLDGDKCFNVVHYAATVAYNVTNFVVKNRDTLVENLVQVGQLSKDGVMKSIFDPPEVKATKSRTKKKLVTLGSSFRSQLSALIDTLTSCQPHFVRCVKPNSAKVADEFESEMVVNQMRCAGLLEVCRIRRVGFPVRMPFDDFFARYHHLDSNATTHKLLLDSCEGKSFVEPQGYAIGHTKVFLRIHTKDALEAERDKVLMSYILRIQATGRYYLCKQMYVKYRVIVEALKAAIANRDLAAIQKCLTDTYQLPHRGKKLSYVLEAQELVKKMEELKKLLSDLQNATRRRELSELQAVLEKCMAEPDFVKIYAQDLDVAQKLAHNLEQIPAVAAALSLAVQARDIDGIQSALSAADELALDTKETREAATLLHLLEEQVAVRQELEAALAEKSIKLLSATMKKAEAVEIPASDALMVEAAAFCESRKKQLDALTSLQSAVMTSTQSRDWKPLAQVITEETPLITELGADSLKEVDMAKALVATLQKEEAVTTELAEALGTTDIDRLKAAVAAAEAAVKVGGGAANMLPTLNAHIERGGNKIERLEGEAAVVLKIKTATVSRDPDALRAAITSALEFGLDVNHESLTEANNLLKTVESEAEAKEMAAKQAAMEEEARAKRAALDNALKGATMSEDLDTVMKLLNECTAIGYYEGSALDEARTFRKRVEGQTQAKHVLEMASQCDDLIALNSAIRQAEEVGYQGPEVFQCTAVRNKIEARNAAQQQLDEAEESNDLEAIRRATEAARDAGVAGAHISRAEMHIATLEQTASLMGDLASALLSEDTAIIARAIEAAAAAGTPDADLADANKTLALLRAIEDLRTAVSEITEVMESSLAGASLSDFSRLEECLKEAELNEVQEPELIAKARSMMEEMDHTLSTAANDDFHFSKCTLLRTVEEWSSGIEPEQRRIELGQTFLTHTFTPIHSSLSQLDPAENNKAKICHREILIFCGDLAYSSPWGMGHSLLARVHASDDQALVDEVYLLICKHLTKNPGLSSAYKGYRLFGLLLRTVPPSLELKPYLKHFLTLASQDKSQDMGPVVVECIEMMEAITRLNMKSHSVSSEDDIKAFVEEDNHTLRRTRRESMRGHILKIKDVKKSTEQLEKVMGQSMVPNEVKDALAFADKHPENSGAVQKAKELLQVYSNAQNIREAFNKLLEDAQEHLKSGHGVEEFMIVDLRTHVHTAESASFSGISETQVAAANSLISRMQEQVIVKSELERAIELEDVDLLTKSTNHATSSGNGHMSEYAEAKALLDKLAPNVFAQLGNWFSSGMGLDAPPQTSQSPKTPSPMQSNSWKLKD